MSERQSKQPHPQRRHGPGGGGPMGGGMMPAEKAKDFKGSLGRLASYLKPQRFQMLIVAIAAVVSVVFNIWGPKILGNAVNTVFSGAAGGGEIDFDTLLSTLLFMMGVYLISALFNFVQQYVIAGVTRHVVYTLRQGVDVKLDKLPLSYFDSTPRGDILSRVTNDIDNISSTLQQNLTQLVTAIFTLIGVLVMMFTISPMLAGICLIVIPVVLIAMMMIMKRSQKAFASQWDSTGKLNGQVEEAFTGNNVVRLFEMEDKLIADFNEENARLTLTSFKAQFLSGIVMPMMKFVDNFNFVLVCVVGALRVGSGQMTLGDVQAMTQYTRQFTQPLMQSASIANVLQSTVASAERIFKLLDETEEIPNNLNAETVSNVSGLVEFKNVSFRYLEDTPLIRNLNLTVRPGQKVAIVGPTGAGKTTLVNLLMRFYEIQEGSITIDGKDITDYTRENLRDQFGMVLQDTWLFSGTIKENIGYGREGASDAEIIEASLNASSDHFIRTLEHGYETVINEEASNISQGQKQLLTIARAFLSNPNILILDEATSSVDTRTEVLIQKAMAKLMENRTSFIIAHRLSTIRDAEVILVMKDGDIIEQGRHDELLDKGGFYAELYNSQFSGQSAS